MKRILSKMAYVLLVIGLAGCSSDEDTQNIVVSEGETIYSIDYYGTQVPYSPVEVRDYPQWLRDLKNEKNMLATYRICVGTLNNETIYHLNLWTDSSIIGFFYDQKGKPINFEGNFDEFITQIRDVRCIYYRYLSKEYPGNSLSTEFLLQDESGNEKYVFKEGETIVFRLDVINNSEDDVVIQQGYDYIIGNDVFHVYSSNGEDFGKPYDALIIPEIGLISIPKKSRISYLCPWVNSAESGLSHNPRYLQYTIDKLRPLPKGVYYSKFTLRLGKGVIATCKKSFKIE